MTPRTDHSPYLMKTYPTSNGRIFLARAFEHLLCVAHGLDGSEIAEALRHADRYEDAPDLLVENALNSLGATFAEGAIATFARPFGGGDPVPLPPSCWELDDFAPRFASSAIDPSRPFDGSAVGTHWIFVDRDQMTSLYDALAHDERVAARTLEDSVPRAITVEAVVGPVAIERVPPVTAPSAVDEEGLLDLDEVKRLTSLSRSTIYRRMDQERFPRTVDLDGNLARWRRREISDWLRSPK